MYFTLNVPHTEFHSIQKTKQQTRCPPTLFSYILFGVTSYSVSYYSNLKSYDDGFLMLHAVNDKTYWLGHLDISPVYKLLSSTTSALFLAFR